MGLRARECFCELLGGSDFVACELLGSDFVGLRATRECFAGLRATRKRLCGPASFQEATLWACELLGSDSWASKPCEC